MLIADTQPQESNLWDIILPVIPWVVIIAFIWFFVFRKLRGEQGNAREYRERAYAHMTAVEAKLDRMIELLERQSRGE